MKQFIVAWQYKNSMMTYTDETPRTEAEAQAVCNRLNESNPIAHHWPVQIDTSDLDTQPIVTIENGEDTLIIGGEGW